MLLVEDDVDLSRVLVATMDRHGVEVRVATSTSDAHRLASEAPPDLLVVDVRLGSGGDGLELLTRLRDDGLLRGVPVVVYTAMDVGVASRAALEGMHAVVLTKSLVPPEAFEARVLQLLGVAPAGGDGG